MLVLDLIAQPQTPARGTAVHSHIGETAVCSVGTDVALLNRARDALSRHAVAITSRFAVGFDIGLSHDPAASLNKSASAPPKSSGRRLT